MAYILMTPEGKRVRVNLKSDECIYDAPHNPPNTGTRYTDGTDLYMHITRSGNKYFYTYHWSMWQGTEASCELLAEQGAKDFLLKKAQLTGYPALSASEIERAEELFPGIFDEDA